MCNQKRRVQKTCSNDAISHGPWFSHSINPPQIHRHLTFPDLDYLLAIAHRSTCNLKTDRPNNASLDTTHSSGHTLHIDASEENARTSFMDCIHSLRTQALPSNIISYKPEVLIVPPILPLSLSVLLQQ